jgi:hypothetical protein
MMIRTLLAAAALGLATLAQAQPCPDKNLMHWQAFPPGGESDMDAFMKECAAVYADAGRRMGLGKK